MSPRDPLLWELSPVWPPYRDGMAVGYDVGSASCDARKQPLGTDGKWSMTGAHFDETVASKPPVDP